MLNFLSNISRNRWTERWGKCAQHERWFVSMSLRFRFDFRNMRSVFATCDIDWLCVRKTINRQNERKSEKGRDNSVRFFPMWFWILQNSTWICLDLSNRSTFEHESQCACMSVCILPFYFLQINGLAQNACKIMYMWMRSSVVRNPIACRNAHFLNQICHTKFSILLDHLTKIWTISNLLVRKIDEDAHRKFTNFRAEWMRTDTETREFVRYDNIVLNSQAQSHT